MSTIVVDLNEQYRHFFGTSPKVGTIVPQQEDKGFTVNKTNKKSGLEEQFVISQNNTKSKEVFSITGSKLQEQYLGVEIWLPTSLRFEDGTTFYLPYSVIRISGSKTIVRTALAERRGTVKEQFNVDDYKISIKGFLIDKSKRIFPEADILKLKQFFESTKRCFLSNALSDHFLAEDAVVITSFELPEVEGGKNHVRPFVLGLESDGVFTLEVE